MATGEETTPCRICQDPTNMLGTKLCGRCWNLRNSVQDALQRGLMTEDCIRPMSSALRECVTEGTELETMDPIDPSFQALSILRSLERWCVPGKGLEVVRIPSGKFVVSLIENVRLVGGDGASKMSNTHTEFESSLGATFLEGLAQIAQVANFSR